MAYPQIITLVILVSLGLAATGWVIFRRRQLQFEVQSQFRAFREQAVVLMDQLDSLRQRHKTMTSTDPDFEVPMAGATRRLYDDVSTDLDQLWDRWLKVMEIWNRAQERLATGWNLTAGPTEEAKTLLEGDEIPSLVRATEACRNQLDRLNQAHETARAQIHDVREEIAVIHHEVTKGTGVLLPSDLYHDVLEQSERALADAELKIAADPIGAEELIRETRSRLGSLSTQPQSQRGWQVSDLASHPILGEISAAADRLRATASKLWSTNILAMLIRAWLVMAAGSLLMMVMLVSAPLLIFVAFGLMIFAIIRLMIRARGVWF